MKNIIVIGLGNPGDEYNHTRHNLGIDVVRSWVEENRQAGTSVHDWKQVSDMRASVAAVLLPEVKVSCLFPLTFMNDSGQAVAAFVRWSGVSVENIIAVHDDIELAFGEVEVQADGSAHGHNGLRSLFDHLGTQRFDRLRVGIGRPQEQQPVHEFVLKQFSKSEQQALQESVIPAAVQKLTQLIGTRLT